MTLADFCAHCLSLPHVEETVPFGPDVLVYKVGGKMFASMGAIMEGVSIKTDSIETAQMLIEAGVGKRAPYFHGSWINISWDMDEDELTARLANSYNLIRASLPKKVQASLAALK